MVINLSSLPQEVIEEYTLLHLVNDGCVCIEIQKGMYGLPQAGILANYYYSKNYHLMDIDRPNICMACGSMKLNQFTSRYYWMILELNTLGAKMQSISKPPSKRTRS
jgi:hypothetical protein